MEKRIRTDEAQKKRVELRLHTNYSAEDGMQRISVSIRFPTRKPVRGVRDWKRSSGSCSV